MATTGVLQLQKMNNIIIAACQPPDIQEDIEQSLSVIIDYSSQAESQQAALICFPECFLQGYVVNERSHRLAIDLSFDEFKCTLKRLSDLQPVLVIGLIEREGQSIYNTAAVIKGGKLLGKYRKVKLFGGEKSVFEPGNDFPVFEISGIRFGINICNDLNFPECSKAVSRQHVDLLVCPCNNMMRLENANKWKYMHNEIRRERCIENGFWLITSDVTGEQNGRISYGPTALIDWQGKVVSQVPLMEPGLLLYELPATEF